MDDMNDLGSHELKLVNAMNFLGLCMTWTNPSRELKALDVINNSVL